MITPQIELLELPTSLASDWDRLLPVITKALPRMGGTISLEGLYEMVERGTVIFWAGKEAFGIAVVMQHELCKTYNILLAGGDGEELLDKLLPVMEKAAREIGCKTIHMDVRPGFIKRQDHTKRGYKEMAICVAKELHNG